MKSSLNNGIIKAISYDYAYIVPPPSTKKWPVKCLESFRTVVPVINSSYIIVGEIIKK